MSDDEKTLAKVTEPPCCQCQYGLSCKVGRQLINAYVKQIPFKFECSEFNPLLKSTGKRLDARLAV